MLSVMLFLSLVFALIPLGGIALIVIRKGVTTVDGLFMSLILLTISAVFLFNAVLELKAKGWLPSGSKSGSGGSKPPAAKPG